MLDPYGLLGVTIESLPSDVRKAYYELSLMVHPDKGGEAADMRAVHNAYKYVMQQVSSVNRTSTVEDLEARFAAFCREQTEEPPRFRDIATDVGESDRFHESFLVNSFLFAPNEHDNEHDSETAERDGVVGDGTGYGHMMERSEYVGLDPRSDRPFVYTPCIMSHHVGEAPEGSSQRDATPFRLSIAPYTEPCALVLGRNEIGSDYRVAFNTTPEALPDDVPEFHRTLSSILQERDALPAIELPAGVKKYLGRSQQ